MNSRTTIIEIRGPMRNPHHVMPEFAERILEASEDWIQHVTPALSNEELNDALGPDVPPAFINILSQMYGHYVDPEQQAPVRTLSKEELTQFETFYLSKKKKHENKFKQMKCNICLEAFNQHTIDGKKGHGKKILRLPCGHDFHKICVRRWLTKERASCPVCKIDL